MTKNPTEFSFENLQADLNREGYNTYIMPVNPDNAVEQILVSTRQNTGEEVEPESPVIQIMFINDLLAASDMADAMTDSYILQFFTSMPFQVDKSKSLELYQLLSVFSRVLPVGAFGLNEDEGAFFRYSLLSTDRNIENKLVVEAVKMISFFINKFSEQITSFAGGQKSLQDVLTETDKEFATAG